MKSWSVRVTRTVGELADGEAQRMSPGSFARRSIGICKHRTALMLIGSGSNQFRLPWEKAPPWQLLLLTYWLSVIQTPHRSLLTLLNINAIFYLTVYING